MFRSPSSKVITLALGVAGAVSFHTWAAEPGPPVDRSLDETTSDTDSFMQRKLDAAHDIVDGLAYEDFAAIERGADALLSIGEEASWKVRRDPIYMHYAEDFQASTMRLKKAAQQRSVESATFAYMHLTVSCTACHQHVRNVVQVAPGPAGNSGAKFFPPGRVLR